MRHKEKLATLLFVAALFGFNVSFSQEVSFGITTFNGCNQMHLGNVTVTVNGNSQVSNENGDIYSAGGPPGTFSISASSPDLPGVGISYAEYFVNGAFKRIDGNGTGVIQANLTENGNLYIYLGCNPNGQEKARAIVTEIGGAIKVRRSRSQGFAFSGMQLRDGDTVIVSGTAKLKWLDGDAVISFDDPARSSIFIIGPGQSTPTGNLAPGSTRVNLIDGLFEFLTPPSARSKDPADYGRFQASNHTIICGPKGTRFKFGYDAGRKVGSVFVIEGEVLITPVNPSFKQFILVAGQQVQVGETYVGPITNINTSNTGVGISGTWYSADGQAVQMNQNGNQVSWSYHGAGVHMNLMGNASGTFDGRNVIATYNNREESITSTGTINLVLNGDRLEGTWYSTNPRGESGTYLLTRNPPSTPVNNVGLAGDWVYYDSNSSYSIDQTYDNNGNGRGADGRPAKWSIEGNEVVIRWDNGWVNRYALPITNKLSGFAYGPSGEKHSITLTRKNGNIPTTSVDISGTWYSADGQAVQMNQNGNQVSWSYHGAGVHMNLMGNASGTFDGRNVIATYNNREESITSTGTINLVLNGDRLEGTWYSTNPRGESGTYLLTRNPPSTPVNNVGLAGDWVYYDSNSSYSIDQTYDNNGNGRGADGRPAKWSIEGNEVVIRWDNGWVNRYALPITNKLSGFAYGPSGEKHSITLTRKNGNTPTGSVNNIALAGNWVYYDNSSGYSIDQTYDNNGNGRGADGRPAKWSIEGNELVIRWDNEWVNRYALPITNNLSGFAYGPSGEKHSITLTRK